MSTSEKAKSSNAPKDGDEGGSEVSRPPAKRRLSSSVIEISDTDSDDSSVCAVTTYRATAAELKRIRGDYSSSSSSSEYSSGSESPWEDDSVVLPWDRNACSSLSFACATLNTRADRTYDLTINSRLQKPELIAKLSIGWENRHIITSDGVHITSDPFRLCVIHDLLSDASVINNIVDDMNTLDWSRKRMDLYEFHQTADLASLTWQRSIRGIYHLLQTEIMDWVSNVTGAKLSSVSASCSLYGPGDHLLVHDDLLADRRIAFILYLAPWKPSNLPNSTVENGSKSENNKNNNNQQNSVIIDDSDEADGGWCVSMGGALELLARDESGRPTKCTHRVYPRNNMLAFFAVGHDSYHQVSEVTSMELPRLSINGWFHGPEAEGTEPAQEPLPPDLPTLQRPHNDVVLMNLWLESTYMSPRSRLQIQNQMEKSSEVSLHDFLQEEKYTSLVEALDCPDVPWELSGPANQRHYSRLPQAWVDSLEKSHPCRGLISLMSAIGFMRFLTDCTDLQIQSYRQLEVQKWTPGDFTLLPPREFYCIPRLEATLYLGVSESSFCGGQTIYLAPEEPNTQGPVCGGSSALVTVPPLSNSLSLVYCDAGAAKFTKYLSKLRAKPNYRHYLVTCTYVE